VLLTKKNVGAGGGEGALTGISAARAEPAVAAATAIAIKIIRALISAPPLISALSKGHFPDSEAMAVSAAVSLTRGWQSSAAPQCGSARTTRGDAKERLSDWNLL
jgi:hypothetical protein